MAQVKPSDVAVIVATKNEAAHLKDCVDSILAASHGDAEIILVDDASTDETPSILQAYGNQIRVLKGEGKGPGRARNLAWRSTEKKWIAFTDGDCAVARDWLIKLGEGLNSAEENVLSIGGIQQVSQKAGRTERWIAQFFEALGFVSDYLHHDRTVREVKHNPTCNVLYSRLALERVDGFDETLWPCEDLELDIRLRRLGFRALFQPQAVVEHRRPPTVIGLFKMMKRYGFGHAQLVKKHGICQPLHILPIITPIAIWGKGYWLCTYPKEFSLAGLIMLSTLIFGFTFRARSFWKGILFTVWFGPSMVCWLFGFYTGLVGERRIAATHE